MAEQRSLEVILEELRFERERQLRHAEGLDAKAGIILGFAGALVALSPVGGLLVDIGRFSAVLSGLLAVWTFWPRGYWILDLRSARELYLTAEAAFTKRRLLDTQIVMAENLWRGLRSKARRLKGAMAALAVSASLTALGLGLD